MQGWLSRLLAATTRSSYLLYCHKFATHVGRSPEELGEAEIRDFLMHLIRWSRSATRRTDRWWRH